jgi:hypothetical protein
MIKFSDNDSKPVEIKYKRIKTSGGMRRYSALIVINGSERIILDEDSLFKIKAITEIIWPVAFYSRIFG